MPETCFRVDSPSVIYEKFDDELVAINLDTGVYHSLTGAAADAFELLTQEATQEEVSTLPRRARHQFDHDRGRDGLSLPHARIGLQFHGR